MLEIHLILIFMIAAAVIALRAKDLASSVVAVGGVGIGVCMAFLILKAPDLAITQLVVEILSLIILVRATIRRDLPFSTTGRWFFNTAATLLFLGFFLFMAYQALASLTPFGNPLMTVSRTYIEGVAATGRPENVVEVIAFKWRAFDTLGEVVALFASMVGVLAVARRVARDKD